jgi:thiamine transport system ATP-binding protein
MLAIEGVTVAYPGATGLALDTVGLDLAEGEVVALLGPSGCGKSTLLRVVAGLVRPSAGRVVLDGRDLAAVPTHQRGIGLMFQDYALFPHRDVGGNVEFGLRMRRDAAGSRARRVAEVLDLVGLAGYAGRAVSTLSGGERQRVALARALAPAPRLLMLDEPLGALDRTLREELLIELSTLFARLALTVVYVTHDQTEALAIADRVVIMNAGRVARQGRPRELWQNPESAFVARFLGFTNLIDVAVVANRAMAPWGAIPLGSSAPPRSEDGPGVLLVRPDAIRLADEGAVGAIRATVGGVVFRGERSVISLDLGEGIGLDAERSTRDGGGDDLVIGSAVWVTIDHAGVQVLSAATGGEPGAA